MAIHVSQWVQPAAFKKPKIRRVAFVGGAQMGLYTSSAMCMIRVLRMTPNREQVPRMRAGSEGNEKEKGHAIPFWGCPRGIWATYLYPKSHQRARVGRYPATRCAQDVLEIDLFRLDRKPLSDRPSPPGGVGVSL
ncbi:hypothetical protein BJ165DRAFT_1398434 [Panaeolus papilionaceus]|nr:hypothetical protein BJ165DRAFT_1398434 [Panaeolus papilionaceus]